MTQRHPIRQRFTRPDGTVIFEQIYPPIQYFALTTEPVPYCREHDGDAKDYYIFGERIFGKFTEELSYVPPRRARSVPVKHELREEVVPDKPEPQQINAAAPAVVTGAAPRSRRGRAVETLAPPGECVYCDARRARSAEAMRRHREKKDG